MKKGLVLTVVLSFMFITMNDAHAWFGNKKKTDDASTQVQSKAADVKAAPVAKKAPEKKVDKAKEAADKNQKALAEKKRQELNNTEWLIELSPLSGQGKKDKETVIFKNNQVSFVNYGKKGFPITNYTLTVQDDNQVVWETMQTSEKSGVSFWRGEMSADMQGMRGVLSHQIDAKAKEDFSFVSVSKKGIPVSGN
ncbi:MAG: hypothetical protein WDL87_00970 [Candidatus Omnitrophota bacterium]|jgi:hypothetical protein